VFDSGVRSPGPRRAGSSLLAAAVLACAAAGCSAEPCSLPTRKLQLSMARELMCDLSPHENYLDGVFHPADGGFVLTTHGLDLEFKGPEPAIPDGTFVRFVFWCFPGGVLPGGSLFWLQNLPSLDGAPNPTEPGSRVWYSMGAGGYVTPIPTRIPFAYALELACTGTGDQASFESESIVLIDADPVLVVKPGETASFEIPSGRHAGSYEIENVNITFAVDRNGSGPVTTTGEIPISINYRIVRAD
jgi:hypothetical protein